MGHLGTVRHIQEIQGLIMLTLDRESQKGSLAPRVQSCDLKLQPKAPTYTHTEPGLLPAWEPGLAA